MAVEFALVPVTKEEYEQEMKFINKEIKSVVEHRNNIKRNISLARKDYDSKHGKGKFDIVHIRITEKYVNGEEDGKNRSKTRLIQMAAASLLDSEETSKMIYRLVSESFKFEEELRLLFKNGIPEHFNWNKAFIASDKMTNSIELADLLKDREMMNIGFTEKVKGEFGRRFTERLEEMGFSVEEQK